MHKNIDDEDTVYTEIESEAEHSSKQRAVIKRQGRSEPFEDTRKHPRYLLESRLIHFQGGQIKSPALGQIADLSEGGLRFHVKRDGLAVGDVIAIEILDRNGEHVRANCVGIVKRFKQRQKNLFEVAVEFRSLGLLAKKYVRRIIKFGTYMRDVRNFPSVGRKHAVQERKVNVGQLLSTDPRIKKHRYD